MLRYYAIASAIVVFALALALALAPRERPGLRPQEPGISSPTPQAGRTPTVGRVQPDEPDPQALERFPHAPWALSVLPGCFAQRSVARGTVAFVRRHIPREFQRVPPGTLLTVGECRVHVYRTSVLVVRGDSVLFVPPLATVSVAGDRIALFERTGTHAEFRTYEVRARLERSVDREGARP